MTTPIQLISASIVANVPAIWWGKPGIGKTAILSQMGESYGLKSVVISLATRSPEDVGGLPVPDKDNQKSFKRLMDPVFQQVADEPCLLVIDELNRAASRATMNAALRGIQERTWGDLQMHPDSRIVATGNPSNVDSGAADLPSALANRFQHVHGEPDSGQWFQWMLTGESGAPAFGSKLPDTWRDDFLGLARRDVVGFLTSRPQLESTFPKDVSQQGGPWASRRSWTNAASLWAVARAIGDLDLGYSAVAGTVGDGAALEFVQYVRDSDLPDPRAILANPSGFVLPKRMDQHFAVLGSVVAQARKDATLQSMRAAEQVLVIASQQGARDAAAASLGSLITGASIPGWTLSPQTATTFMPTLVAAGWIGR